MKNLFQSAKVAAISLGCVVLSFLFLWVFVQTGMNHRLGNSMDKVGWFAVLSPCLIAVVLALASLIWNPRKAPGLIALIASVVGTWVLFHLGA